MGMHESQSLFWERHILLSKFFWKKYYSVNSNAVDEELVYHAANTVEFSNVIRVEAG
jgi:Zn-dependent M32 family carboxypeptidase